MQKIYSAYALIYTYTVQKYGQGMYLYGFAFLMHFLSNWLTFNICRECVHKYILIPQCNGNIHIICHWHLFLHRPLSKLLRLSNSVEMMVLGTYLLKAKSLCCWYTYNGILVSSLPKIKENKINLDKKLVLITEFGARIGRILPCDST